MNTIIKRSALAIAVAGACLSAGLSHASSHREAPFITEVPKSRWHRLLYVPEL